MEGIIKISMEGIIITISIEEGILATIKMMTDRVDKDSLLINGKHIKRVRRMIRGNKNINKSDKGSSIHNNIQIITTVHLRVH